MRRAPLAFRESSLPCKSSTSKQTWWRASPRGIEEPGDAGVGADGLNELQVSPSDCNQGCQDSLVGDLFDGSVRDTEGFLVEAEGLGGILDHYGDVVDVPGLADRCGILCHWESLIEGYRPDFKRSRDITMRCTSEVPSYISVTLASRKYLSTGLSLK